MIQIQHVPPPDSGTPLWHSSSCMIMCANEERNCLAKDWESSPYLKWPRIWSEWTTKNVCPEERIWSTWGAHCVCGRFLVCVKTPMFYGVNNTCMTVAVMAVSNLNGVTEPWRPHTSQNRLYLYKAVWTIYMFCLGALRGKKQKQNLIVFCNFSDLFYTSKHINFLTSTWLQHWSLIHSNY